VFCRVVARRGGGTQALRHPILRAIKEQQPSNDFRFVEKTQAPMPPLSASGRLKHQRAGLTQVFRVVLPFRRGHDVFGTPIIGLIDCINPTHGAQTRQSFVQRCW